MKLHTNQIAVELTVRFGIRGLQRGGIGSIRHRVHRGELHVLVQLPFDARFDYDREHNSLFLNFSELSVKAPEMIERLQDKVRSIVEPLGHKVYAVVNYDGFELDRSVEDAYLDALKDFGEKYFHGVTRFTTSAFMRAKLGDSLASRGVAPYIFESEEEARGAMRDVLTRNRKVPESCADDGDRSSRQG